MPRMKKLSPLNAEAGARLVGASDADEFGTALLDIAHSIAGVDELFAYIVLNDQEPDVLISKSTLAGVEERVRRYVDRFYRHDPAVQAIKKIAPGDSFVQRISLSSIIPHDYRKHCFTEPGFSEKVSFGWRSERYLLVVSFYGTDASDGDALNKLANLASMTLAVLVRQHAPIDRSNATDVIEARLRRAHPALSDREAQICALTIVGNTSLKIATDLNLSAGSVLTYRQRAYQKTGVGSAAELIPQILN
jgi:DNA-binding CsgD family transcriptional regulator